ncbi:MAG: SWI/SNF-related matrix-associated actin-dependent regulator of chromatin subfamily A-like protein 1 [Thermoleophilaceae bacterium]|jgi:superfamily II DNA or RNA helicase|nr:SWI/SNF-related matrix-associated actin-dependent regulator of chromatin subfamily A-like protein 1 [Thermoleophilaceae bacterium]
MDDAEYGFEVDGDGICLLRSPWDPALRRAIRAIPGRFWDEDEHGWTIRLTPDRAESVARLLRSFPVFEAGPGAMEALETFRDRRNLRKPMIEGVTPDEEYCLSLCDDWVHPVLDEMRRFFRPRPHPEIGRLSVPVTDDTRNPLLTLIERNGVGLNIRARQRLSPAPATSATRRAAVTGLPQRSNWRGWVSTTITDYRPYFVFATRGGIPPQELYDAGGVRQMGEVALVPMDGRRKPHVETLLARNRQMLADPRVYGCLDHLSEDRPDDPPPPAIVTIVRDPETGTREFVVQVLWDDAAVDSLRLLPESRSLRGPGSGDSDGEAAEGEGGAVVADASTIPAFDALVREHRLGIDEEAQRLLDELLAEHAEGEELVALSRAHEAEFEPPPGLHGKLMPFQTAGIVYALRQKRTFIADEQGLGKTLQALTAIESADAYPAVVVCPASLKLNWLREVARWLPGRRAEPLSGRRGPLPMAEIIVVNYDVLEARADALADLEPGALVLDESHYVKNPKANRTKAAIDLSARLPEDALRLALTGTPLVNRPRELVPQLRALGRLGDFGSGASFERRFEGQLARERLHWHLRSTCYVRRRKDEVLTQLPPKRRITVPMPLSNEPEYRHLEEDLVDWLRHAVLDPHQLAEKIDSALRAEALVKLNALRHVAARGKLHAATEWIKTFLESGERLVVFAHHRDIQNELVHAFPRGARILGSDSVEERQRNVELFQKPKGGASICICSLEVASHGFTLTAAASVAFLELGWTPAKHDQAEDRVHRIGQDRHVTAWYLLAADTIDERIAALIDYKRAVVGSVTDGSAGSEATVIDRLLIDLAEESSGLRAA